MIKNTEKLISSEEIIRIFDDASQTAYDSYAIVWWQEEEPVIAGSISRTKYRVRER